MQFALEKYGKKKRKKLVAERLTQKCLKEPFLSHFQVVLVTFESCLSL